MNTSTEIEKGWALNMTQAHRRSWPPKPVVSRHLERDAADGADPDATPRATRPVVIPALTVMATPAQSEERNDDEG
jgi:hypothetical protein